MAAESRFAIKADETAVYPNERLPVVRFANGRVIEVPYVRYTREEGGVEAYVWRMALHLAWATSIHKSPSQTLDAVEIDIADSGFDTGMVYAALSCVKSLDALRLTRDFAESVMGVDPTVVEFHERPYGMLRAKYLARLVDLAEAEAAAVAAAGTARDALAADTAATAAALELELA